MDAVVLVGGQGSRLRPLTLTTPKPMLPVAGVPFLAHLLARARAAGVTHAVLGTSYRSEVFAQHLAGNSGHDLDLDLEYVTEVEPLGTAGGIRNVAARLRAGPGDPVLVLNGDILSGLDIRALLETHRRFGADVTLHLHPMADVRPFGMVPTDGSGRVTAFLEKPQSDADIVTHDINAGCYVFRREVIDAIPPGRPVSVERETFPALLAAGALVQGHLDTGYWLDLGTPPSLIRGSCDLVLGRVPSPALPGLTGASLVLGGAEVAADATLAGGTVIGAGARVAAGAEVTGSVVFDDVMIGPGAVVRDSVLGRGVRVGAGTVCESVVLGDGSAVGAGCELRAGLRLWPGVELPAGSVRFSA